MLREFLDRQLARTADGQRWHFFHPLVSAIDAFLFEKPLRTTQAPYVRDAVDLKRWMSLVVFALLPACFVAIWNTGLQTAVYQSADPALMKEYLDSLDSIGSYLAFSFKDGRFWTFMLQGLSLFLPLTILSYTVGGAVEALFAMVRRHEIAEGFLVTGLLYPLILPPTIPYWMAAIGIAVGVIISKEIFGGTGMNIMNPAMTCRAFLFFTFPGRMSGDVWVGEYSGKVRESLQKINETLGLKGVDAVTQSTHLAQYNVGFEIKKIHTDTITAYLQSNSPTPALTESSYALWQKAQGLSTSLQELSIEQFRNFITAPLHEAGLGLSSGLFENAYHLSEVMHGIGPLNSFWTMFLGNKMGCLGETSALAAMIGAVIIIFTGIGSYRTMAGVLIGALTFGAFLNSLSWFSAEQGALLPAIFDMPAYRHLVMGGLAFGLVFMATDPVSSPSIPIAQWVYGIFIGVITIVIRAINPAYPEGVMLAVLMGNVFAPLFDYYAALWVRGFRRRGSHV